MPLIDNIKSRLNLGGRGRQGGFAEGPGGKCMCPTCGYSEEHEVGKPCMLLKCPECGKRMTRKL